MKLTKAQRELLLRLPDEGTPWGGDIPARFPPHTRRRLQEVGYVKKLPNGNYVCTPAGATAARRQAP